MIQTGCTIVGSEGWRRDIAHALGLRVSTLTYSEGSMLGDGCNEPNDRGLTAFGRQAVQDLNRLGITVDISHVGGRTASEIVTRSASSMIAVAAIGPTGGHADAWKVSGARAYHWMPHPGHPLAMADGVEEMRRTARELMRAGADVLKVCATGGVMSVRDSPHHEQFSAEEMQVLVDEAARLGKHVMAHAQGASGIEQAVIAGVRSIEHGTFLSDRAIELMLERGTWFVPTMVASMSILDAVDQGVSLRSARSTKRANADLTGLASRVGLVIQDGRIVREDLDDAG